MIETESQTANRTWDQLPLLLILTRFPNQNKRCTCDSWRSPAALSELSVNSASRTCLCQLWCVCQTPDSLTIPPPTVLLSEPLQGQWSHPSCPRVAPLTATLHKKLWRGAAAQNAQQSPTMYGSKLGTQICTYHIVYLHSQVSGGEAACAVTFLPASQHKSLFDPLFNGKYRSCLRD